MTFINEQAILFLVCVQTGVVMGMVYDIIRIIRKIIPHPNWLIQIEDLLYWILCAGFAFIMIYWNNYGQIRGFAFIGMIIGGILYFGTLSIIFMKLATIIIDWSKRLIRRVIKIILIPVKLFITLIRIPYTYIRKICSIINTKRKKQISKARHMLSLKRTRWAMKWRIIKTKR